MSKAFMYFKIIWGLIDRWLLMCLYKVLGVTLPFFAIWVKVNLFFFLYRANIFKI